MKYNLMIFIGLILSSDPVLAEVVKEEKPNITINSEMLIESLRQFYTVTNVSITKLDGYTADIETSEGIRKLPKQIIDAVNYTVRIASTDKNEVKNIVFSDYGVRGQLVCMNPAIRPLIMSKKAVVIISIENSEGEPQFMTVYDNHSCRKK